MKHSGTSSCLGPLGILLLSIPACLVSCKSAVPPSKINELYRDVILERETQYRVKPGDTLIIGFFNNPEFNQTLLVLADGRTDPFFMDNLIVSGKTVNELRAEILRGYRGQVLSPQVQIKVQPANEFVYLEGYTRGRAGQQPLFLKMTLFQILAGTGGYDTASIDDVILRRPFRNPLKPDKFIVSLYDDSEEIVLLPNDHIIIRRTWWILIRDYLREYIWGILPFDPRVLFGAAAAGI